MLSPSKSQEVASLVVEGVPHNQIAKVIGVSPSTFSELINSDSMKDIVAKANEAAMNAEVAEDGVQEAMWESLDLLHNYAELSALERLHEIIPFQTDAKVLLDVIRVSNSAQMKGKAGRGRTLELETAKGDRTVNLMLPVGLMPTAPVHKTDLNNNVIAVDGVSLNPSDEKSLDEQVDARHAKQAALVEKLASQASNTVASETLGALSEYVGFRSQID